MKPNVQTVQMTRKFFKGQQVIAVALGLAGVTMLAVSDSTTPGSITLFVSFVYYMALKVMIWWNHA